MNKSLDIFLIVRNTTNTKITHLPSYHHLN